MLILTQIFTGRCACMVQQGFQGMQFAHPEHWRVDQAHAATQGSVEHPLRHFQALAGQVVINRASKYDPVTPYQCPTDQH